MTIAQVVWLMPALACCYCLNRAAWILVGIHKELVKIRLATESLHDRLLPEALIRQVQRSRGCSGSHACGKFCRESCTMCTNGNPVACFGPHL